MSVAGVVDLVPRARLAVVVAVLVGPAGPEGQRRARATGFGVYPHFILDTGNNRM